MDKPEDVPIDSWEDESEENDIDDMRLGDQHSKVSVG